MAELVHKFVHTDFKPDASWNQMAFFGCKVLNVKVDVFEKSGKRLSIEVEVPKLKKKFFVYTFNDGNLVDTVEQSGVKIGDVISFYAELTYYKNSSGRYCEAYKIRPNVQYVQGSPETPTYFQFMRIVREAPKPAQTAGGHMTKDELLNKMLGL